MKKCNITRSYVTLLPLIWLASFGYEFARLFLNTDWRVFEPSISFVLFVLMAKVYFKEIAPFYTWRSRIILFLTSVVVGIVTFSDPYFFYFTVVPAVALFVILALFRKITPQQLAVVLFVAIVGTVADEATKVIAARIGLLMPIGPPEGLTSMHALLGNVLLAGKGMLTIYGVNHMYKPVSGLQNVASLLNLAIVIFIAYQTCKSLSGFRQVIFKKGNKEYTYPMFFSLFLGLLTVFAVVVWVLSNVVVGIEGYRYFIILPFVGALLLVLSMGLHAKATVAISYLLTFAIVVNTITALYTINQFKESTARNNIANRADYALVNAVRNYGLSKGYAGYWDGNINTYLSKGKVQFLPVACIDHETRPLYLLVDKSLYKQYSRKSFYVLDPDASMPNTCSYKQVVLQYGKPQKVIHVLDKLILVYNYDLMTRTAM